MEYLQKINNSKILSNDWKYINVSHHDKIRRSLIEEQKGYCAYSERYLTETDLPHIEHFDPRKKNTADDDYYNWYAVFPLFNTNKPKKISAFLPILAPNSPDIKERIKYNEGFYEIVEPNDIEAQNLIDFLGFNKDVLIKHRQRYINTLRESFTDSTSVNTTELKNHLNKHPENCSFITAIRAEFGIDI